MAKKTRSKVTRLTSRQGLDDGGPTPVAPEIAPPSNGVVQEIDVQGLFALLGAKEYDLAEARTRVLQQNNALAHLTNRVAELEGKLADYTDDTKKSNPELK